MTAKKKSEPDDQEQSVRFVETARELGADESGRSFQKAIGIFKPLKKVSSKPSRSKES